MKMRKILSALLAAALVVTTITSNARAASGKTKLNKTSLTLTAGKKKTIKIVNGKKLTKKQVRKVKWSSSNKRIVKAVYVGKYRQKAVIEAKMAGSAVVKVKYNGKTYRCRVTVKGRKVTSSDSGISASADAPSKSEIPDGGGVSTENKASNAPSENNPPVGSGEPGENNPPVGSSGPSENNPPTGSGEPGENNPPMESRQPSVENPQATVTAPFDSEYTGDDAMKDYVAPVQAVYSEEDKNISREGATEIIIPEKASGEKVQKENYSISAKNKVKITASGTYIIRTENCEKASDGLLEVDYASETDTKDVHLILDNIYLTSSEISAPTSDKGLITIKKSVPKAVITLAENTENTLMDTGATGIDEEDGVSTTYTAGIVCRKTPLTINGKGKLSILSENGNGIKCTNELKILDARIVAGSDKKPLGHNGITGKTGLFVKQAELTVYAAADALKTTLDKTDIAADNTLEGLGNMELSGGVYHITSTGKDAVSVFRTLLLNPEQFVANASYKSASSSDDTSSKAVKAGTTIYVPATAGSIDLTSARDDTLHSNAHIRIDGGTVTAAAGDDAIHSDTGLLVSGGVIHITKSYEGIESGDITIAGGEITVVSSDDGLNAAGGNNGAGNTPGFGPGGDWFNPKDENNANSSNYQIIITGGNLTVDAGGDGIDSNGNIFFKGGTVVVNGPTNAGNGALDYGDWNCVCEISGGTLIAAGAQGMDVAPTGGSSQPAVNVRLGSTMQPLTYVVLKDANGDDVMVARPTKTFQSVVMSCEKFVLGNSYTVYYGASLDSLTKGDEFTFSSVSVSTGSSAGGGPGGWNPGGPGSWNPGGPGGWNPGDSGGNRPGRP